MKKLKDMSLLEIDELENKSSVNLGSTKNIIGGFVDNADREQDIYKTDFEDISSMEVSFDDVDPSISNIIDMLGKHFKMESSPSISIKIAGSRSKLSLIPKFPRAVEKYEIFKYAVRCFLDIQKENKLSIINKKRKGDYTIRIMDNEWDAKLLDSNDNKNFLKWVNTVSEKDKIEFEIVNDKTNND